VSAVIAAHQIESPKQPTKKSAQGRLPHNNNVSTIEFLRPQNGRQVQPIGHMEANNRYVPCEAHSMCFLFMWLHAIRCV
jgi:hypothetical protein